MKKTYSVTEQTVKKLQEIEDKNGAYPSKSIDKAVDDYHKKIIEG